MAARVAARRARAIAHAADGSGAAASAATHALAAIAGVPGVRSVAGYLPIRDEIDPRPALQALAAVGMSLCLPAIEGTGLPLTFRSWVPGSATGIGRFGVEVPLDGTPAEPDLLLVPLLAFDARGHRLGYGGGFYDRTIALLRERRRVVALGFAYAAQRVSQVPDSATDMRLDGIVTEAGTFWT